MKYERESFTEKVRISNSLSDVARHLGLSPSKGNRDTIKKYIVLYNIDTSHFCFVGQSSFQVKKELNEILVENSTYPTTHLKNRLYDEGLKIRKCELCNQDENWQGKKMSLILDHINGDKFDNRIENLRIVCPNCNATLETNCSKNKTLFLNYQKLHNQKCLDCEKPITKNSLRCKDCSYKDQRKVIRPDISILSKEVEINGFVKTGMKYGVSDNTIRKWLK